MGNENPDGSLYAPEQVEETTRALLRLHTELFDAPPRYLRTRVLKDWHAQIAAPLGVQAGEWREGPITFGSYEGAPAHEIGPLVRRAFRRANVELYEVYAVADPAWRLERLVRVSAYVHARLIKIHPFEDGNGRVARLVLTGMFLGAQEDPPDLTGLQRGTYLAALNRYNHAGTDRLECRELQPLIRVLLELLT